MNVNYRACLDTSECGDLANCKLLGEYSKTRDFTSLTSADLLNYSINVHNKGNTLEVVSMCCECLCFYTGYLVI